VSGEAATPPEGAAEELAEVSIGLDTTSGDEGAIQVAAEGEGVAAQATAVEAAVMEEAGTASLPAQTPVEGASEAAGAETSAVRAEVAPEAVSEIVQADASEVADTVDVTQHASDAVAANGEAGSEAAVAAVEPDVVIIEVWRPKRRHEGGGRRGRGRGRSPQAQRDGEPGEVAARNGEGRSGRDQEGGRRRGAPEKRGDGGGRQRGKNKRHDGGRRNSNVHTSSPARQKGIDPDSPFAKLSALKESLNKGGDG
jgi:ATP-dependent RNA helicase SUPV3L1/SUV3